MATKMDSSVVDVVVKSLELKCPHAADIQKFARLVLAQYLRSETPPEVIEAEDETQLPFISDEDWLKIKPYLRTVILVNSFEVVNH